jgi:hypothetical protein
MRKVDFTQDPSALRTGRWTERKEPVDAARAHLVVTRRDEQSQVLLELTVRTARWAYIALGLRKCQICLPHDSLSPTHPVLGDAVAAVPDSS